MSCQEYSKEIAQHINLVSLSLEQQIFEIYTDLRLQSTLEPSPIVNSLFERLVNVITKSAIGKEGVIFDIKFLELLKPGLNNLCARGEGLLERHWVKQFLSFTHLKWADIEKFPYFNNYQLMSDWEHSLLSNYLGYAPQKILFVGSGSLPLSAMLMSEQSNLIVDCLDIDEQAVKISTAIIKKCDLSKNVKVIHQDFFSTTDFSNFDAVIIAALVGTNELGKKEVLRHLQKNLVPGQAFLIRSATGLKTLFYQEVKSAWLTDFRDVRLHDSEYLEIINSLILAKK